MTTVYCRVVLLQAESERERDEVCLLKIFLYVTNNCKLHTGFECCTICTISHCYTNVTVIVIAVDGYYRQYYL